MTQAKRERLAMLQVMLEALAETAMRDGRLEMAEVAAALCAMGHTFARRAGLAREDVIETMRANWKETEA